MAYGTRNKELQEGRVRERARVAVERFHETPACRFVLEFGERESLVGESIAELETDPRVLSQLASGLKAAVGINFAYVLVNIDDKRLHISVNQETHEPQPIFVALHQWATRHRPALILRVWMRSWLFMASALLLVSFAVVSGVKWSDDYKRQARVLAERGVSEEDRDEALTTILAVLGDYSGKARPPLGHVFSLASR